MPIAIIPDTHGIQKSFQFYTFYHPYVCNFVETLNREGIDGLMNRKVQLKNEKYFAQGYKPSDIGAVVNLPYPTDDVDFTYTGSYSLYNWELFFHAPLLIADRLSKNQRFEEAQKWFHYIFNPTDTSSANIDVPKRYWITRKFYETYEGDYQKQQINELMERLANQDPEVIAQVDDWRSDPFKPHLIARLRTVAYQKTTVMKYIDNLISWGDQLFRRDTIESINEATQLYILAAEILGKRPEIISLNYRPKIQTYNSLPDPDKFGNALVEIENLLPEFSSQENLPSGENPPPSLPSDTLNMLLYFCIPHNEKLLGYWDTVADRLFKIRHCMNIEGIVRQLPLFEPPIEPGFLVRAAAAGIDINSALNDLSAPLPIYRFRVMLQKAIELCSEVKALGAALLSALEKRDAEALALLRSSHEIGLLEKVQDVKDKQKSEAFDTWEGLNKSKDVITARRNYYQNILPTIPEEEIYLDELNTAALFAELAQSSNALASVAFAIPEEEAAIQPLCCGNPPTPAAGPKGGVTFGGSNVGHGIQAMGAIFNLIAEIHSHNANRNSIVAGYKRRWDDWKLQETLANKELPQIDKQIDAAKFRWSIADKEVENHKLQIQNSKEVDAQMHDKFTNQDLYDWMIGQISAIYFQCYQLAFDIAKSAERAYRFELGLSDSNFIQFGYWDNLKKGLLAGDKLYLDLKRMEMAYLDQNKREYEITKHISLATIDPVALVKFKETGECFFNISETLLDIDNPGHYMRRIKSVSVTLPCIVGPYTSVNCRLTLVKNSVRKSSTSTSAQGTSEEGYVRTGPEDPRFVDNIGSIQSIVTSTASNDAGLFELNFNDERYLPFEGAGAISQWRIELDKDLAQFDHDTISDVIIHLRYTAREGGEQLKNSSKKNIQSILKQVKKSPFVQIFSASHGFPNQWYQFLHPNVTDENQTLRLPVKPDRFLSLFRDKPQLQISKVELFLMIKDRSIYSSENESNNEEILYNKPLKLNITPPSTPSGQQQQDTIPKDLERDITFDGLPHAVINFENKPKKIDKDNYTWTIEAKQADISAIIGPLTIPKEPPNDDDDGSTTIPIRLDANAIEDLIVILHYAGEENSS